MVSKVSKPLVRLYVGVILIDCRLRPFMCSLHPRIICRFSLISLDKFIFMQERSDLLLLLLLLLSLLLLSFIVVVVIDVVDLTKMLYVLQTV